MQCSDRKKNNHSSKRKASKLVRQSMMLPNKRIAIGEERRGLSTKNSNVNNDNETTTSRDTIISNTNVVSGRHEGGSDDPDAPIPIKFGHHLGTVLITTVSVHCVLSLFQT